MRHIAFHPKICGGDVALNSYYVINIILTDFPICKGIQDFIGWIPDFSAQGDQIKLVFICCDCVSYKYIKVTDVKSINTYLPHRSENRFS